MPPSLKILTEESICLSEGSGEGVPLQEVRETFKICVLNPASQKIKELMLWGLKGSLIEKVPKIGLVASRTRPLEVTPDVLGSKCPSLAGIEIQFVHFPGAVSLSGTDLP